MDNDKAKFVWSKIINVIIAVFTAIASTIFN